MQVERILKELGEKYPDKAIFKNDEKSTTEILCEVEPSTEHPEYSNAVAVIDKSTPHAHYKTTETYKVTRGTLALHVDNEVITLKEGESYVIKPVTVHWAEGKEVWIEAYSAPGWTFDDHILVKQ